MNDETSQRDGGRTDGGAGEAVVLVAPAQARGAALTSFAMQVRAAAVRGPVLIDDSACWSWSPGQRLVLERLRAFADRCSQRALVVASTRDALAELVLRERAAAAMVSETLTGQRWTTGTARACHSRRGQAAA